MFGGCCHIFVYSVLPTTTYTQDIIILSFISRKHRCHDRGFSKMTSRIIIIHNDIHERPTVFVLFTDIYLIGTKIGTPRINQTQNTNHWNSRAMGWKNAYGYKSQTIKIPNTPNYRLLFFYLPRKFANQENCVINSFDDTSFILREPEIPSNSLECVTRVLFWCRLSK